MKKQMAANKASSPRSPKPKAIRGKANASQEAQSQHLSAAQILIVGEDASEYEEFTTEIIEDLKPVGQLQQALAERAATISWRLKRIPVFEAAVIAQRDTATAENSPAREDQARRDHLAEMASRFLPKGERDQDAAQDTASDNREKKEKDDQSVDHGEAIGRALIHDSENSDVLGKILRSETVLNNALGRTLRMLTTLQSARDERG